MIPKPQQLPTLWFQWPEARFGRFNFQRDETVDAVAELLVSDRPPAVVVLGGERGIGRRYLCEAAAWRARQTGRDVAVWHLDLDGFEPEAEHPLRRYIEHLLQAQDREIEMARARRAGAAKAVARTLLQSNLVGQATEWAATLVSLVSQLEDPVERFAELLSAPARADGRPPRDDPETLRRFLAELTRERKLLVHVRDGPTLPRSLRRWLVLESERAPDRLLLVVSCGLEMATGAVIPSGLVRHEPERFDIHPLDTHELRQLLDRNFAPNAFPSQLAGALERVSHGRPAELALRLSDLLEAGALDEDARGVWRLPDGELADERVARVFSATLLAELDTRLEAEGDQERTLRRFLELAALCGPYIPAMLLLEHLQLPEEKKEAVIDFLDDHLVADLAWWVDLEFRHPAFPRFNVYASTNPLLSQALIDSLAPIDREMLAINLLRFLEGQVRVETRGMARLFLAIAEHLGEREREPYELQLAWWIGIEETEELQQEIREGLEREELNSEVVWRVVNNSENHWPAFRRLALLDAYSQAVAGEGDEAIGLMPTDRLQYFYFLRAHLLWEVGRYSEALEEALNFFELSQEASLSKRLAFNLCGLVRRSLGLFKLAEDDFREALRLSLEMDGQEHLETLNIQGNLAGTLHQQGQIAEARALLESVFKAQLRLFGPEHLSVLKTQNNLADILQMQGELPEARAHFESVLTASRCQLGPEHHSTLIAQHNLAFVLREQGELAEARAGFERVLEARRRRFGPDHPDTLRTQFNLALALRAQGELAASRTLLESVLEAQRRLLGPEHPDTLSTQHNLAFVLGEQGELVEARAGYESVLEARRRWLGPKHPETLRTQYNLAITLRAQGELAESQAHLENVLEVQLGFLTPEHPDLLSTQHSLAGVMQAQRERTDHRREGQVSPRE